MKKLYLPVALLSAAACWLFFNWPLLIGLHQRWLRTGEPYAVGYPILLISLWCVFHKRQELSRVPIRPSVIALLLFAGALLISVGGRLVQLQLAQQIMIPVSLGLAVTAIFGWRVGWLLKFPFLLLFGAVPIWDFLVNPLRRLTVLATQNLLDLFGIPAFIDGFHIMLPSGTLNVADGCSGLNLLLAAIILGLLQTYLGLRTRWRQMAMMATAIVIGIVDNWIRVFSLALIAHYSQMQSPLVYSHGNFGWWIFGASLIPFFFIAYLIERGEVRHQNVEAREPGRAPAETMAITAIFAAAVVLAMDFSAAHLESRSGNAATGFDLPYAQDPNPRWQPAYVGYDLLQSWRVEKGRSTFDLTALIYTEQTQTKKLIYYSNRVADAEQVKETSYVGPISGSMLNASVIKGREWRVVWWFYWVDGALTNSALQTKLLQLKAMLFGDPSAALIAFSMPCRESGCDTELRDTEVQLLGAELVELLKGRRFGAE